MNRRVVVYVDVDDTLVRSFGSKRIPMTEVVERVRRLHGEGALLYCWSSGGAEYAKATAMEVGIGGLFEAFLPKPQLAIDDVRIEAWPELVQLHPRQVVTTLLHEVHERLGWT